METFSRVIYHWVQGAGGDSSDSRRDAGAGATSPILDSALSVHRNPLKTNDLGDAEKGSGVCAGPSMSSRDLVRSRRGRRHCPDVFRRAWHLSRFHAVFRDPERDLLADAKVGELRVLAVDLDLLVRARLQAERVDDVAFRVQQVHGRDLRTREIYLGFELRIALAFKLTRFNAGGRGLRVPRKERFAELDLRALDLRKLRRIDRLCECRRDCERQGKRGDEQRALLTVHFEYSWWLLQCARERHGRLELYCAAAALHCPKTT